VALRQIGLERRDQKQEEEGKRKGKQKGEREGGLVRWLDQKRLTII